MWNTIRASFGETNKAPSIVQGRCFGKGRRLFRSLMLAGAIAVPLPSFATVFAPSFAGPSLDAGLAVAASPGTSFTVGGGTLALDQATGAGNGEIFITTTAPVNGDFVATVNTSGVGLGRADLGLVLGSADWSDTLADVFLNDNAGTVNGNIFQPVVSGQYQPKTTDTLTLTIARSGDTVTESFDAGAGPVVINSGTDPSLNGPIEIGVFLLEAAGDTAEHSGAFSNFQVTSGADLPTTPVPEPAMAGLMASGVLALCGVRAATRRKVRGAG